MGKHGETPRCTQQGIESFASKRTSKKNKSSAGRGIAHCMHRRRNGPAGPEDKKTGAPHEMCKSMSVVSVSGPPSAMNCNLLITWDRLTVAGLPCRTVEIFGEMTGWNRVPLVRVDDVRRGTYFHLTLRNMPVGVRLRLKFCVDGVDTVDNRYEVENDDGFGNKNNIIYVDPKIVRPSQARFPVTLPFFGEAHQRATQGTLASARMPEETIETVRLYHNYKHMRDIKDANPDMGWAEVRDRAELEVKRANRRKVKKKKKKRRTLAGLSVESDQPGGNGALSKSMSVPSGFSALMGSSSHSMASSSEARSSYLYKSRTSSAGLVSSSRAGVGNLSTTTSERGKVSAAGLRSTLSRKKRHPRQQQAGTLSMCQGLSIYELENRIQSVVKTSRRLASGAPRGARRKGRK